MRIKKCQRCKSDDFVVVVTLTWDAGDVGSTYKLRLCRWCRENLGKWCKKKIKRD